MTDRQTDSHKAHVGRTIHNHGSVIHQYYIIVLASVSAGMRLRYTERGSGEEAVLLLHDVAESGGVWDDVACRLADLDYRVFAIDLRGVLSKYATHYYAA
jgi:alpha-beta hydrolase superfamily lysophospholipase